MSAFEKFQRTLLVLLIALGCFYGGYYFGKAGYIVELRKNPPKIEIHNQNPISSYDVDFKLFWNVWDLVSQRYLERPVDPTKMLYGAISGMVSALGDPYTSFLPPKVNETVSNELNGKYKGIGAELGMKDSQLIVVSPMDGSPAKAAGVKPQDKILAIDNISTIGISVTEAVSKIRGDAGTKVTLKLQTGNNTPRDTEIMRGVISVPSIVWEDKGDGTAYVRISRFGGETNEEWAKIVSEVNIKMRELDAVIIDVRGNPGGYLNSAVFISEEFFKDKPVLWQENALGDQTAMEAKRLGAFHKLPGVIVMIDGGSASASEIIAAALRDNIGAKLVGTKSFGKGSIQDAQDFSDGSGIHITIAKWLTPKKVWIHRRPGEDGGIAPDYVVERTEEDYQNNRDPQLDKALELAKEY